MRHILVFATLGGRNLQAAERSAMWTFNATLSRTATEMAQRAIWTKQMDARALVTQGSLVRRVRLILMIVLALLVVAILNVSTASTNILATVQRAGREEVTMPSAQL